MNNTAPGLNIFREGTHVATDGTQHTFTTAQLRDIAASYDPQLHEAPLVVGHPTLDAPAYGWAKSIVERDGELYAEPTQVEPQFAELVNKGRFKKISASIYLPDTPGNPKPGHHYLKHVGFLGAAPPAVKGLRSAQFSAGDGALEFAAPLAGLGNVLTDLFQRVRDYVLDRDGIEKADQVIPHWQIRSIGETANWPDTYPSFAAAVDDNTPSLISTDALINPKPNPETDMSQNNTAEFAEAQRKLNEQKTDLEAREKAIKDREQAALRTDAATFAESLVNDGKLLPRFKTPVVELLTSLHSGQALNFAEGGQQVSTSPAQVLRDVLTSLPKQIDFSEKSAGEFTAAPVTFAAPPGTVIDAGRAELHGKAQAYQRQHPNASFIEAVKAVGGN